VARQLPAQLTHASGGGGGDDDLEVGHSGFHRADQLCADVDLPHAHGVYPESVAVGYSLLEFGIKLSKSLPKAAAPFTPPLQAPKIIWR